MKRILVVDDDPSTLDVIILLFEMEGFEVLGLMDCVDLYNSISNQHRHIPVLQMSVVNKFYNDPKKPLHADDYIEKPFDLDVMVSKVRSLMNNVQIN
ncbi:MAG: hypothetical protein EOO86_17685 [Pedobacter sp.]|nr:MAG: hypothetical protein EOO86_17685 [Pedobacter sp.]